MKTTKLEVEYDYDFEVYALISPLKEYKLAWCINKTLDVSFRKLEDIHFQYTADKHMMFSNYGYETEYSNVRMLKNKSCEHSKIAKPYLLSELKDYDYIIQVEGELSLEEDKSFFESLKEVQQIQYITQIEIDTLKSKENLIY